MKITISIPEKKLDMLDYLCDITGDGRSRVLQNLIVDAYKKTKYAVREDLTPGDC